MPESPNTCPACSGTDFVYQFAVDEYPQFSCRECGLEMLYPQPSDAALDQIYNEDYQLAAGSEKENQILDTMKTMTAGLYLDCLAELGLPPGSKMLEIGCGWGHFIGEATKAGFDAYGVELSPHAAEKASEKVPAGRIINTTIDNSGLSDASFDLCVMIDVIEHIRAPHSFLDTVSALLKPGGHLFIVVPSTDSLSAKLMGRYWMEYKPEHLYSFSRRSLSSLLVRGGYSDIRFRPARKALNLNFIRAYLERFTVPGLTQLSTLFGKVLPDSLLYKQLVIPAGGMICMARKAGGKKN